MPPVFAICDMETDFTIRFMEFLNRRKLPFEVQMFTSPERLCEFGKKKHIELLLISERAMCGDVMDLHAGKTILLSENAEVPADELPAVYKYQSGTRIVREVMDCYSAEQAAREREHGRLLRRGRLCGIYSLSDPTDQMLFSVACGQVLAETQSVLYVNLHKYSGLDQLGGETAEGDLSDLLYLYRSGQGGFSGKLAGMVRQIGRLAYIPASFCSEDIGEMTGGEWQGFLGELSASGGYDTVLLDLGNAVRGLPEILRQCTDVWLLSEEDAFSLSRRKALEAEWEEAADRARWLSPPQAGTVREGTWFLETLSRTSLGDYARRHVVFREEEEASGWRRTVI